LHLLIRLSLSKSIGRLMFSIDEQSNDRFREQKEFLQQ
jgi:hypothetical protein